MKFVHDIKIKTIALIVMVVFLFNGYNLYNEMRHSIDKQKSNLEINSRLLVDAQALASIQHYWVLNFDALEDILDGLESIPEFSSATFYDENDKVITTRKIPDEQVYKNNLIITKDLYATIPDKKIYQGRLEYQASYKLLDEFIHETLVRELLIQFVLFVVLCFLIYIIIGHYILNPLKKISSTFSEISEGKLNTDVPFVEKENQIGKLARSAEIFKTNTLKIIDLERTARLEAEEANKMKDLFFARLTHELRTPLHGINGFSQLLLKEHLKAGETDLVENINNLSNNMIQLVNEILDFSAIRENNMKLKTETVEFKKFVEKIKNTAAILAKKNNNILQVEYEQELPDNISIDALRFEQVLYNLLSNASKFTCDGVIKIILKPEKIVDDKVWLYVAVSDTGIGISDEYQEKGLFEVFTQEDGGISRTYGGTGLGLSISNQLIRLMGGELNVKSQKDIGTKFYFTLPVDIITVEKEIKVLESTPEKEQLIKVNTEEVKTNESDAKDILVVDDDRLNRTLLKKIIENMGHNVVLAEDGIEAVSQWEENQVDLIFMDIMMPNKDGLEATTDIRAFDNEKSEIPIIATTAYSNEKSKNDCRKAGLDDFMPKPFSVEDVANTIQKHLIESVKS